MLDPTAQLNWWGSGSADVSCRHVRVIAGRTRGLRDVPGWLIPAVGASQSTLKHETLISLFSLTA